MKTGSARIRALKPSMTVALTDKTRALKNQGKDIISFTVGEPDFDTPAHIVEAACQALRAGSTHYVASRGIPKLLQAIARKLEEENGITVDPQKGIIVTASGKLALNLALMALLDPGDEVILLEPAWVSYEPMVQLASGVPVPVPLDWRNNFAVDEQKIESRITPRTKVIIVNSPGNPTGRVLSLEEIRIIERIALKHDLFIISDEIYDRIVYDVPLISPGSLPTLSARTLTVNGFSKTYAMTGWRLGYVAGNPDLISLMLPIQQHLVTCAASFAQEAAVAGINGPREPLDAMIEEYRKRREFIVSALNDMPGVSCPMPDGAFYAFPRFEGQNVSSSVLAEQLLEKALISVTPGVAFGQAGESHLRFSFACSIAEIEEGMKRLRCFLDSWRNS